MHSWNQKTNGPRPEMDGLSPDDMFQILYHTLEESSPICLSDSLNGETLIESIPFLKLMFYYLNHIDSVGELKLTAKGNLPRKLVLDLYDQKIIQEELVEKGIIKLNKETDSIFIQNVKIIGLISGLTKKRNGKMSLTAKGRKLLKEPFKLFELVFLTYAQKFNWGYHDGYFEEGGVQSTFGFLLYLLIQYGQDERESLFYSQKHATAFPMIYEEVILECKYGTPEKIL